MMPSQDCFPCLYEEERWRWDNQHKSPNATLSSNQEDVYFHTDPVEMSTGTAGVRGTKGFTQGEHYWEVILLEPPFGTSVMIGVGTASAAIHTDNKRFIDLIGSDSDGWGLSYKGKLWHNGKCRNYCDSFYDENTVIGCHLNLYNGTLTFFKNGVSMGVAFSDLDSVTEPIYPMVSSTTAETELGLGRKTCRYSTLQKKCCFAIKKNLNSKSSVDSLPLPRVLRNLIREL